MLQRAGPVTDANTPDTILCSRVASIRNMRKRLK